MAVDWERIIGTREASEIIGTSIENVKLLCRKGELDAKKLDGAWVIDRESALERKANPPKKGRPRKDLI